MHQLIYVLPFLILLKMVISEPDFTHQDQLDPLAQPEFEYPAKEQSKRFLFGPQLTHGWGRHVGIHPSGFKYVIGYGPIELKYVPVVKPITLLKPVGQAHGWRPTATNYLQAFKPVKQQWHVKSVPSVHIKTLVHNPLHEVQNNWKPMVPVVVKPIVPANVPLPSEQEVSWKNHAWNPHKPLIPVQPIIPVQTVPPVPAPPVLVPQIPIKPIVPDHSFVFQHVPIKPAVQFQPFVPTPPVLIPQAPVKPVIPVQNPIFFPAHTSFYHLTKPNLPVLPFGATFPAQVLPAPMQPHIPLVPQTVPIHSHLKPGILNLPISPGLPVQPPYTMFAQPLPVKPVITFHGNPKLVPFFGNVGQVPIQPPIPPAPQQPIYTQIPVQPVHTQVPFQTPVPVPPHQLSYQPHSQIPVHAQIPFNSQIPFHHHILGRPQITLPKTPTEQHQPQVPVYSQNHHPPHGQQVVDGGQQIQPIKLSQNHYSQIVPNQPDHFHEQYVQQSASQEIQNSEESYDDNAFAQLPQRPAEPIYQQPLSLPDFRNHQLEGERQLSIQPGQTDLQIPLHLPEHPNYRPNVQYRHASVDKFSGFQNNVEVFRPSISLQPPYDRQRIK